MWSRILANRERCFGDYSNKAIADLRETSYKNTVEPHLRVSNTAIQSAKLPGKHKMQKDCGAPVMGLQHSESQISLKGRKNKQRGVSITEITKSTILSGPYVKIPLFYKL